MTVQIVLYAWNICKTINLLDCSDDVEAIAITIINKFSLVSNFLKWKFAQIPNLYHKLRINRLLLFIWWNNDLWLRLANFAFQLMARVEFTNILCVAFTDERNLLAVTCYADMRPSLRMFVSVLTEW